MDVRISENIHWYLSPPPIQRLLNVEPPEQSRNREESALLSEALSATDAPAPPEGHIALLIREGAVQRMAFDEALGREAVWLGEVLCVAVDGPDVALDPGVLGDEPALCSIS